MSILSLLKNRYSVRDFQAGPVEPEILEKILQAGLFVPSACNNQPNRIYVIKSPEGIQKIRELTPCAFNAPVVLLIAGSKKEAWKNPLQDGITSLEQDASIAATQMMLEAWSNGIGSCWVGYFPPDKTAEAFSLPPDEVPVLLLPIGYPAGGTVPGERHGKYRDPGEILREL